MKLLIKISALFLLLSGFVFMIGGIISFQIIKRELDLEEQYFLMERLQSIESMIQRRPPKSIFQRDKLYIEPMPVGTDTTELVFSDTLVIHSTLQRVEPHTKLEVIRDINGVPYKISIYDLIVEEDDIADGVRESLLKTYLLLFAVVVVLTIVFSRLLLSPFNHTLSEIRKFSITNNRPLQLQKTTTTEFRKLNSFLEIMTSKMQNDYLALKEFTENASHEMQTPISGAKGKLELLLDSENLTDEQMGIIADAQHSLIKLTNLFRSLSLLTKIENAEFANIRKLNFSKELETNVAQFSELIELRKLTLKTDIRENVEITVDPALLDMLVSNLIKNAIRHNVDGGEIHIRLQDHKLVVENTGKPLSIPPEQMFERFKKSNQSNESLGLGLSIVKKITEISKFTISYQSENNIHRIVLNF